MLDTEACQVEPRRQPGEAGADDHGFELTARVRTNAATDGPPAQRCERPELDLLDRAVARNFVIGLESFDVPLFLGTPVGIDVFATRIYSLIYDRSPEDYAGASALALLLVYVQYRVLGRRTFTTVTGKGYRTEPWDIGGWRWLGTAFIVVFLLVAIVAPLVQLVLAACSRSSAAAACTRW